MKKITFISFIILLLNANSFAQTSLKASFSSGVLSFYNVGSVPLEVENSNYIPSIGNKIGLGIQQNIKSGNKFSIDVLFEQKLQRIKYSTAIEAFDENGNVNLITKSNENLYNLSIPVLYHFKFGEKVFGGLGIVNNFNLNKLASETKNKRYELGLDINLAYQDSDKLSFFIDFQTFANHSSLFSYTQMKHFVSLGINYNLLSF